MVGFILLGIGYAVLGVSPNEMASWFLWTALDGCMVNLLRHFCNHYMGRSCNSEKSRKYYAIGIIPFFISKYLELVIGNYVAIGISSYALFSFIVFFLFLAVLPLFYAPETLPEKVMKDRDLKSYVENAKKKAQKESEQSSKKEKTANTAEERRRRI